MALMKIPVVKAGNALIEVETEIIPANVYAYIVELGLKALINRGGTKITKASVPNDDERHRQALEVAHKNLEAINSGKVRIVGSKSSTKASGEVMTEARRLARNMVKDAMKAKKIKVSYVEAKEITAAANALIAADPSIIEKATASLEARKAEGAKSAETLANIVGSIPQSQKLIDAAAKAKAKDAADKPLSPTQSARPKPNKTKLTPATV